jgi:cellulose biosynthesis protein BcsQ
MSVKNKKAIRIAIFNHKGGIGKTTLAFNIAAALGKKGKKVLLVDSDPQCNLTSYLFDDETINDLLDESDTDSGRTIWSALRPVSEGVGKIKSIHPYETSVKNVFLVPGDVKLTNYESVLNDFWFDSLARRTRGLVGTNALSSLIDKCQEKIKADFVIYDTGPNIGPLNRIILLDCDYFIVPAAHDLFSIRALNTLGQTIKAWINDWKTIAAVAPDDEKMLRGSPEFLGYLPVHFGASTGSDSHFKAQLEKKVLTDIIKVLSKSNKQISVSSKRLGEVSDLRALVTMSQRKGIPTFDLDIDEEDEDFKNEDLPLLTRQRSDALKIFDGIAKQVLKKAK